jgi:hypothetical protein
MMMMMTTTMRLVLAVVATTSMLFACDLSSSSSTVSGAITSAPAGAASATAHERERSAFPMQTWMKANASAAMNAQDHQRLMDVFGRIAEIAPTGADEADFRDWKSMAKAGSEAAQKHDLERVRAACKGCHDVYRPAYKARLRNRALPSRTGS